MIATILNKTISTEAIRKVVMDGDNMRCLPAKTWESFPFEEVRMLLHETGTYVIPTEELIDYLDAMLGSQSCIEIGAGNGWIGRELDMTMTDSYMQRDNKLVVQYYKKIGQPTIKYPSDVLKMDALTAVRRFRPHTVLGCYVTHKWRNDTQDGNDWGVDFPRLLKSVQRLILVGNLDVHRNNPLMAMPHDEILLDGLLTRAEDSTRNRIFIWNK